ncbi:hypothetical protein CTA1_3829 [Colletotrichum tanaceti]|uniref:Uncharacterized protein n=1 Tax=Colletotrichum tanaceti TaxID=1306861 RepID=A0A4V6DFF2_9PEZI|nr:hypothetical protein CTA1_3829 [Colletotrichum tanaceti]
MFTICPPSPSEAPSTASIHISSMSSNPLLPLQFPTPASLADLHSHLASDALDHLSRRPPRILVARAVGADPKVKAPSPSDTPDSGSGSGTVVASFAKWDIVRPRRHRNTPAFPPSSPRPPPLSKPALGSRRLEPGRASKGAWKELNGGNAPLWRQHHHQEAEEAAAVAEAETEKDGQNEERREEEEDWPASANRAYLTAYFSAASTARREAMGSRPFLRIPERARSQNTGRLCSRF